MSTVSVGRVANVVALSGELFDAIEVNAARTGNHKRAAVRMSRLAVQATPSNMSRAEAHMRAGEQWMLADDPAEAVEEFRQAIADAGPTFDDPRVPLARAMFALGRSADADALLRELRESDARGLPRTCDEVAELLTEQGDLEGALDWATAGVDACLRGRRPRRAATAAPVAVPAPRRPGPAGRRLRQDARRQKGRPCGRSLTPAGRTRPFSRSARVSARRA